jgi:hypothetical protein
MAFLNKFMLNWPLVLIYTAVLYVSMIVTLPFNQAYATIFLFQLIAFWSRLPGVGMPHPLYILYAADVIDIFSCIIAINIGGIQGAVFSLFGNIISRACGVYPSWELVFEDTISQFLTCLVLPFFHAALGGNIMVSIVVYSILRCIFAMPMDWFFYNVPRIQWFIEWTLGILVLFAVNVFYAKIFGNFFNDLLAKGVQFNWILFFFTTIVILIFYITVFGFSKSSNTFSVNQILRKVIKKTKKKEVIKKDDQFEEMKRIKESL